MHTLSVGSCRDYADFDVVPMQSSSLLLGRPWEFDNDVAHHGRTNTYTFMHKNKKITLLLLSTADIRKHFNEFAANDKKTPPSNDSCDAQTNGIKLKDGVYIATTSAATALCDNSDALYYTILCRDMCFINNDHMPHILHHVVTNLFAGI